jgi:monooxygenase
VNWSNEQKRWTVDVTRNDTGERFLMTTDFLWLGAGYYDHRQSFTPKWEGFDRFKGTVIHPQHWPDELDYAGKRVVVIGSGATAVTLVPNLAQTAAHVTMLQRSPTFFASVPWTHQLDAPLRELDVPEEWRTEILRRAHLKQTFDLINLSAANPDAVRAWLINETRQQLPEGFDVEKHFNPSYRPWQQRVAAVPEGELFTAIREGKASVVTETIESFDESGITLTNGEHLDADIVVTATGFDLNAFGQIVFNIDDAPVDMAKRVSYRGMMIEGVPNMAFIYGYYRSSWTLRADLVCEFICRVLAHMEKVGAKTVEPRLRAEDADMQRLPWTDPNNFNAGYVMRSQHQMHMRGDRMPWQHHFEYQEESKTLPALNPDAEVLAYR